MTVQDVVNAVTTDIRQVLSATAPDADILISWVDRVHKECLHASAYSYLLDDVQSVATVVNTNTYNLTPTPRKITAVYDRTFDRELLELNDKVVPPNPVAADTEIQWP